MLYLQLLELSLGKISVMYRGARTYNELDSAKQCKSLPQFKNMLRTVIL